MIELDFKSTGFLVISIVVGTLLFSFFIYSLVTIKQAQKFVDFHNKDASRSYSIIYNPLKKVFTIYLREYNNISEFKYDDFVAHIEEEDRKQFVKFFNKVIKNDKDADNSIIVRLRNLYLFNEFKILKIDFYDTFDGIYFFNAKELTERARLNIAKADKVQMLELGDFISRVSNLIQGNSYYIFCFNFKLYDVIERRYGEGVAKRYSRQIYEYLVSSNLKKSLICHYEKDSYLIYSPYVILKNLRRTVVKKITQRIPPTIVVENFQFELKPSIGLSISRSFSNELKDLIKFAEFASLVPNTDSQIVFFDYNLNQKYKEHSAKLNKIKNVKYNANKTAKYYSITSLDGGSRLGYLSDYEIKDEFFKSFRELYDFAASCGQGGSLIERTLNGMIDKFYSFKNLDVKHLFVKCDIRTISNVVKVVNNNPNVKKINLSIIFTDYGELFENSDIYLESIRYLKSQGILLGIEADLKMNTIIANFLSEFSWLLIPQSDLDSIKADKKLAFDYQKIIKLVSKNNIEPIAFNVFDYNLAEVLKDIGVRYLGNSLLDNRNPNISLRKIAKLVQEREV